MAAEAEISSGGVRSSYQSVATKVKQEGKKLKWQRGDLDAYTWLLLWITS